MDGMEHRVYSISTMSLDSDYVEPSRVARGCRAPSTTPVSASLETDGQETVQDDSDDQSERSLMFSRPYSLSTPVAPTIVPSVASDDTYRPEVYAALPVDSPECPSSPTPRAASPASVPVPFMMAMQSDPLVHRDFKDELTRAAGTVTPGISDVPYIRYAIDAITRRRNDHYVGIDGNIPSDTHVGPSQENPQFSNRVSRPLTDDAPGAEQQALIDGWQSAGEPVRAPVKAPAREAVTVPTPVPERSRIDELVDGFNRAKALVMQGRSDPPRNQHPPRTADIWRAQPGSFSRLDVEEMGYGHFPTPPPLTNKPWVLSSPSLLLFGTLCVFMITALIFSAVYAIGRDGFTPYGGSIYGGQYFLFRVLPQLVGAALLVYAQCITTAVFRIFPFSAMASDDRRERRNAVFLPLYPKAFLWPHLFGPWWVWVPTLVVWLANFTIPLLSSLYTVVYVGDIWIWSTVQGAAWTLVALYISLLMTTVCLYVYWRDRRTGMIRTWDIRSIADVIFLSSQSNSLPQYWGLETAANHDAMKRVLDGTAEKLGYWTTPDVPENAVFWSFGVPTTEDDAEGEKWDRTNLAARRDGSRPVMYEDVDNQDELWAARFRYLPWCFRDVQIISFAAIGAVSLIALVVVSFLPSTDVRNGFLPRLSAAPIEGAFSPANFLYSFLPSLLGLALFLAFQSLDLTLRILEPWGELAREEGSRAEKSLLLDYAACLPWQSTYKAIRNKHWRVAFVSFLSPLFILIPALSGGLFMALTPPTGPVRMFPNVAVFGLVLTLLFLYLGALVSLIPSRKQYRLPHAVTCLADIITFCSSEQLRTDEAFDQEKISRRNELEGALDCGKDWHRQGRWTFHAGKNRDGQLGIKRYSKYTVNPNTLRQYDQYVRDKPISGPLLHSSGSLFG